MSVKIKLITTQTAALFTMLAVMLGLSFLLIWIVAAPIYGEKFSENIKLFASQYFIFGSLIVFFLTGLGLIWFWATVQKDVIGSLQRLERAAAEIRDGNLDYELVLTGSGEFYELGLGFEQMRIKLKNSTHEQLKASEERNVMMASICHDLNTPITSIMGYAEGILDGVAIGEDKIKEYAGVIYKKSKNLRNLADDLSLLSKLETSQLNLETHRHCLSDFLSQIAEESTDAQTCISADISPDIFAEFDSEKFSRVFINIIQNSKKYGRCADGTCNINIALQTDGSSAHVVIQDGGPGIKKTDTSQIFERFYRADLARSGAKGSGLGLSIAKHIVKLHGGKIWVTLPSEGGLATHILLPCEKKM